MKILTFSFDDCEVYDRQVCRLLRAYGMQATFYLISAQLGIRVPFHRYGKDTVVERVSAEELPATYRGMEIASHTRNHHLDAFNLKAEIEASLAELSAFSGQEVHGLAYPGGEYTPEILETLQQTSAAYARGASPTHSFRFPENWYAWQPTCHYAEAETPMLIKRFLSAPESEDLLLHIFGHSYEMTNPDRHHGWVYFESLLKLLSGRQDVVYATNSEAMRRICERN